MNDFNQQPDQNQTPNQNMPIYSWDGKHHSKKRRRRKKPVAFFITLIVCLLLTALVCVPTILYAADENHFAQTSSDASGAASGAVSGNVNVPGGGSGDTSFEVDETVTITDNPYLEESALTELYQQCQNSCVTVYVTFGDLYGYSIGSGFVLTKDGYIATNQHVVDDGVDIKVIFYDGTEYDAELIGEDPTRDLAFLKINAKNLTPLPIGNSDKLVVGQTTVAIGTPYDLELAGTMTLGIISGLDRNIPITNEVGVTIKTMRLIQTDTPINPGNSGGPLINMAGQVIGINSLKLINDYEGIGFAIPINSAVDIFNQLIQYGKVVQDPETEFVKPSPRLGIEIYELSAGLEAFRISPTCEFPQQGVLVSMVDPNAAVYAAGLERFDIITEFAGKPVTSLQDLSDTLAEYQAGDTVTMTVFSFSRDFSSGEAKTFTFVLDSAEALG